MGTPERLKGVKKIIESQSSPCIVVVSAFQGVTDGLKHICEFASERNDEYKILTEKLIQQHKDFTGQIIKETKTILIKSTNLVE